MSASSALLTDITTVITNGPNAASKAKAIAAVGPIQDYIGNSKGVLLKLEEAEVLLTTVKGATDGSDTSLTTINAVLAALNSTANPSTTLITDMGTVITAGPTVATQAKTIAPAGPIQDYVGNCHLVRLKMKEANILLALVKSVTDSTDSANLALINNILTALA